MLISLTANTCDWLRPPPFISEHLQLVAAHDPEALWLLPWGPQGCCSVFLSAVL